MSNITPQVLLKAYAAGVFPMAEAADDPALYWIEPEERGIFPLDKIKVSQSLRKTVRKQPFDVRIDSDFSAVIAACAEKTKARKVTWINNRIRSLYVQLAKMGFAHSVECWNNSRLVGGLYGVRIGAAFFGESMFARETDASKVAFVHLVARLKAGGFQLLDAQFINPHIERLGAIAISKAAYQNLLEPALDGTADFFAFDKDHLPQAVLDAAQAPYPPSK
jgi:leucyl/phenylalanyl-tRNA---protein transferase